MPDYSPMDEKIETPDGRRVSMAQAIQEGLLSPQGVRMAQDKANVGAVSTAAPQTSGRYQDALQEMLKNLGIQAQENATKKYNTDAPGWVGRINRASQGFEEGAERARSVFDLVTGNKDRKPWETAQSREMDKLVSQADKLGPELQRQESSRQAADAKVQAATIAQQARVYEADQRMKSKVYELAAKQGLTDAQTQLALAGAQEKLAKSKGLDVETAFEELKKEYFSKNGVLANKATSEILNSAELDRNPNFLRNTTDLSLAKGATQLFRAGQGTQRTTTGERNLKITSPTGDFYQTFPTRTTSGTAGNPAALQMLQQLRSGGQPQQPVNTSLFPGMSPQGQAPSQGMPPQGPPQAQMQIPMTPPALAARTKSVVPAPAPVNTLTVSNKPAQAPDDFFLPPANKYWGNKQSDGRIPVMNTKQIDAMNTRRDFGGTVSTALESVLNTPPAQMKLYGSLAAAEGLPLGVGGAIGDLRSRFDNYSAKEALIRSQLTDVSLEKIKDFTGKQSNDKEYKLLKGTIPSPTDSPTQLATKLVKLELAFKYWRMVNDGDGQNYAGVNQQKYRTQLDDKFFSKLDKQVEEVVKLYTSGKPVPPQKLDPMKFLRGDIDDIRKK